MENLQPAVIPVGVHEDHADNARIDNGHGARQTRLVGGVKLGALGGHSVASGESQGVSLGMYRRTARTVLGALRISAEELSFLITARALTVVTVRQTGGSSIVAGDRKSTRLNSSH